MKTTSITSLALAALLTLTSCYTTHEGVRTTTFQPGKPGGVILDTYQETATVTAVDRATRKVTLVNTKGRKSTITAGPEVANFAQIAVGDQVKAIVAEETVITVRKPGKPTDTRAAAGMALAPLGAKPAAVAAETVEVTAKVHSIDVKHQKATLQFSDGTRMTYKVRQDVDLTQQHVGDEVVIRVTDAVAISVEKP